MRVYEPEQVLHESLARIDASGTITFDPWSSEPPKWALTFVRRVLEGLARKHSADASWPRKLTRWREGGRLT